MFYYFQIMENNIFRESMIKNSPYYKTQNDSRVFKNVSNYPRLSTISTSRNKNRDQSMNKSKITSLPNYKKIDMSNNLGFVTVFQTIEIERLSEQIETVRVKLKEQERQLFNAQNYEVQIKELTEKCSQYEHQREQYREELERMNKICETLYHGNQEQKKKLKENNLNFKQLEQQRQKNSQLEEEIERWKMKVKKFQSMKEVEINEIKQMMEDQRKSILNRELKQAQKQHKNQLNSVRHQLRRVEGLLDIKNKEYQEICDQYKRSQDKLKSLRSYSGKVSEYQQRISMMNQEQMRLSQINQMKSTQLDEARKKEFQLSQQLNTEKMLKLDNEKLRDLIETKVKETNEMKLTIAQLESKAGKARQLEHYVEEMESKFIISNKEMERLSRTIKEKVAEEEVLRNQIRQQEKQIMKSKLIEEDLSNCEGKLTVMKAENERLANVLQNRTKQVQNLKNKCLQMESGMTQFGSIQKDLKIWEEKCKNLTKNNEQLHQYIENLQNDLNEFKNKHRVSLQAQRSKDYLQRENDRLNEALASNTEELESLRMMNHKLKELQLKLQKCDQQNLSYENKLLLLSQEIQRLNSLVQSKNQQIEQLEKDKLNLHSRANKNKGLENDLEDKEYAISKLKEQISGYREEIQKQQQRQEDQERKSKQMLNDLKVKEDILETQLRNKKNQLDESYKKCQLMKNSLNEYNDLERTCQKQQNRITVYLRDLEVLKEKCQEYERKADDDRELNQNLREQVMKGRNGKDYEILVQKISQLENVCQDLKKKYQKLLGQCLKMETDKSISFLEHSNQVIQ